MKSSWNRPSCTCDRRSDEVGMDMDASYAAIRAGMGLGDVDARNAPAGDNIDRHMKSLVSYAVKAAAMDVEMMSTIGRVTIRMARGNVAESRSGVGDLGRDECRYTGGCNRVHGFSLRCVRIEGGLWNS
jgi:hypothetical protein